MSFFFYRCLGKFDFPSPEEEEEEEEEEEVTFR
jgi:hypothetical protein